MLACATVTVTVTLHSRYCQKLANNHSTSTHNVHMNVVKWTRKCLTGQWSGNSPRRCTYVHLMLYSSYMYFTHIHADRQTDTPTFGVVNNEWAIFVSDENRLELLDF